MGPFRRGDDLRARGFCTAEDTDSRRSLGIYLEGAPNGPSTSPYQPARIGRDNFSARARHLRTVHHRPTLIDESTRNRFLGQKISLPQKDCQLESFEAKPVAQLIFLERD